MTTTYVDAPPSSFTGAASRQEEASARASAAQRAAQERQAGEPGVNPNKIIGRSRMVTPGKLMRATIEHGGVKRLAFIVRIANDATIDGNKPMFDLMLPLDNGAEFNPQASQRIGTLWVKRSTKEKNLGQEYMSGWYYPDDHSKCFLNGNPIDPAKRLPGDDHDTLITINPGSMRDTTPVSQVGDYTSYASTAVKPAAAVVDDAAIEKLVEAKFQAYLKQLAKDDAPTEDIAF